MVDKRRGFHEYKPRRKNVSNLPPGVTDNMIPGNRPEDIAWEKFHEYVDADCERWEKTPEEALLIWQLGYSAYNMSRVYGAQYDHDRRDKNV